jgi:hypothetical protein
MDPLRWLPIILALAVFGCSESPAPRPEGQGARPAVPLPARDQVAKVQLTIRQAPADAGFKVPCEATLTRAADVAEIIDWLEKIDWSQKGIDLTVVKLPPTHGEMVLTAKDTTTYSFGFFHDGRIVHWKANRLLEGGDAARLRQLVRKVCQ